MIFGFPYKLAASAGLALAAVVLFGSWLFTHDRKVVQKERVRVETTGARIDAKAQQKRAAAESRPDLGRWYRD